MARDHGPDQVTPWIFFSMAIAAVPIFGTMAYVTRLIGPAAIPIWFGAAAAVILVFRGPVGQALARRISGDVHDGPVEVPAELYAELDELRARVGELEERVDFSERLLVQKNENAAG